VVGKVGEEVEESDVLEVGTGGTVALFPTAGAGFVERGCVPSLAWSFVVSTAGFEALGFPVEPGLVGSGVFVFAWVVCDSVFVFGGVCGGRPKRTEAGRDRLADGPFAGWDGTTGLPP
jgi:hypothetical protein